MLDNFEFHIILPIHYDAVIEHLRENFFADEPLNQAVGLCEKGGTNEELEKQSLATLADNVSVAVTQNGKIIGVALNGFLHVGDTVEAKQKLKQSDDENFKKIFNFLYDENLKVDFFKFLSVDLLFEIRILSVDSDFRGKGLAKKLLMKSEEIARNYHCKVLKTDATGLFSQKISSSLGFITKSEISYSTTNFPVEKPHESLKIMYKLLN